MRDVLMFLFLGASAVLMAVAAAHTLWASTACPLEDDDDDDDDDTEYEYDGEGRVDPAFRDRYDAEEDGFVQPVLEEERGRRLVTTLLGVAMLALTLSGCTFTIQEGAFDVSVATCGNGACEGEACGTCCAAEGCDCRHCSSILIPGNERPLAIPTPACPADLRQGKVQGQATPVQNPCPPVPLRRPSPSSRSSRSHQRAAREPEADLFHRVPTVAGGDLRHCRTTASLSRDTDVGRRADPRGANAGVIRVLAGRSTPAIT